LKAKTKLTKLWSFLLSLVMLLSLLPTTALAADTYPKANEVSVDGGKYFAEPGCYYFKNGATACSKDPKGSNATYDPTTGTLTLDGYNGGSIEVGGTESKITVVLVGNNSINNGSLTSAWGGDITVTSSSSGTLSISKTTSGSNPAIGIETGYGSTPTGNVTIKGNAKVTINMTHNGTKTYDKAYGIFAKENITISENASVDITCATPNNTTGGSNCNGLYAAKDVTIDTNGTIKIDVTKAGKDDGYSFGVYPMGKATLTKVGNMEVQWKKHATHSSYPGGVVYKGASLSDTDYAINEDTTNCYASYRFGTPRKVTVQDGQLTGPGVKYANNSGYFLVGDKVNITPDTKKGRSGEEIPFKEWTSSDVMLDKSATTASNSFTVPGKDVTVTAKHSPFDGTPTFTPIGTTGTEGTLTFKMVVKADAAYEGFRLVKEGNENNESSYIFINSNTTSTSSPYEYSYKTDIYNLDAGNYYVVAYLKNDYYLSEKFTVNYTAPVTTYTVSFDANGGTGAMTDVTDVSGEYTLPANGFTAPSGKQFKAWSVGGVEKAAGDKITVTANTTVIAVWEDIPVVTYTVSFDANGGTGTMADVTDVSGEYTLPANGFTAPAGKQFKAWSVGGVEKAAGDKITVTANTTVTAVWEAIEYNITVTDGKATVGAGTPITKATMGTTVTLTANAAPSGKVFDKWEVVSGGITLAEANSATTTFTMPASAVSVKATYKNAPHTHTYNQETVKPEALKTPADCTNNAVYFKSCSCGAISTTDTFVAMDTALGHAHGSDWKYDSTNHWHECSRCHDKKDEAAHDYGSDNVCDTCGYDKTVPHTHNLTLVAAKAATCTTAGNSAYYTCDGCDKWFADATGSVEITDKTSVKIPAPGHTAGTEWKSDDTNHWHECTVAGCGVIIESTKSAHTAGEWIVDTPATATTAGTKHKECTVCHRVLETQPIPSTGTELKIIAGDNQIYNKASGSDVTITCNGDFAKFTGIKVDGSVVDSSNYTAVSGSTVLTLKASYIGTLTDGSHTITFVYTDGEANANLTVRTAGSGHIHDYGTEWKSNADNHWHECNCGDKKDEAAHSFKWVVDKEATATKKGSKHEECKICGYKRSAVEIPATGTSTAPTDTTKPNDTTKPGNTNGSEKSPQTGDNSNIFLWFALLFVSAAGVTGITAYNKKKKEHAE